MNERTKKNRQRNQDNTMANTKKKCNFGQTGKKNRALFLYSDIEYGFRIRNFIFMG